VRVKFELTDDPEHVIRTFHPPFVLQNIEREHHLVACHVGLAAQPGE